MNIIRKIFFALATILAATSALASSNIEKKSADNFYKSAYWFASNMIVANDKSDSFSRLDAKIARNGFLGQLIDLIYSNPKAKYSRDQIARIGKEKLSDKSTVESLFGTCREVISCKENFAELLTSALTLTPPAFTNLDNLRGGIYDYQNYRMLRVNALGFMVADNLFIKQNTRDMNFISVDIDNLSSSDKSKLYKKCGYANNPCRIEIWGRVRNDNGTLTISAEEALLEIFQLQE